jgi:hypothetical protein
MAVLALFTGDFDKSQYDALRKEVEWETRHAAGAIVHAAGVDDGGKMHVADVWESPEALNTFVADRLMPAFKKLSLPQPNVEVFPVHNLNALPAIDAYKL